MMGSSDGWEDVSDPSEARMATQALLPAAPPSRRGGGGVSPDDRKALVKYRDAADAADTFMRSADNFEARDDRFHTGAGKAAVFGAMYPDSGGVLGGLKQAGGALLRGTVGYLYPDQDHEDYQYLNAQAHSLNNAGLRLNKGVQTEGDAQRIARENVGVDKTPAANHDIVQSQMDSVALAKAREASASKWLGAFGGLAGTKNAHGLTYDEWFNQVVKPQALQHARTSRSPAVPAGSGWSITRIR